MKVRQFDVAPNIPERLTHLKDLAMNLWFCWNWQAVQLFIRLDSKLWEQCYQNPVLMLGLLPQSVYDDAANDESFVADLEKVYADFSHYLTRRSWFERSHGDKEGFLAAYFSCEYGIDEGLPIYSGGLGILSGDHLKSASDLGVPLVAVGLLYQKGYFKQQLNLDGWQKEHYLDNDWFNMPVTRQHQADGYPVTIRVNMAGEDVYAHVWKVQVGRTPLYLLDTNIPENPVHHRCITSQLYGGDKDMRIRQEIILGIGGIRALDALGIRPSVYHINEGHSAFMILERMRELVKHHGFTYPEAKELVWASTIFTTHTPVPAGNEVFDLGLVGKYLGPIVNDIGISWEEFAALGKSSVGHHTFSMPALALGLSAFSNGVSALHGKVSREMWRELWPSLMEDEIPINHVTNGIHTRSWISHDLADLLDRYLGPRFKERPEDQKIWEGIDNIPDMELWRVHEMRRERLVFFARKRMAQQLARQGAGSAPIELAEEALDQEVLTLGFARRFATYKRAGLLLSDPERLARIITNSDRPMQIVFAGKAHPQDSAGKELIKDVIHFARRADMRNRVVFLENYDINVARYLVQGVDVWMNTPLRPMEASGTSGMKAAANGIPNLSVLDGWWVEGCCPEVGWMFGERTDYDDPDERDRVDGEALYNILEHEVGPLFYDRDRTNVPRQWVKMMKACLKRLASTFNTHRMVREYAERAYIPAHLEAKLLIADGGARARQLAAWRRDVTDAWPSLSLHTQSPIESAQVRVGDRIPVNVHAKIAPLMPEDIHVEVIYGPIDAGGRITSPACVAMRPCQPYDGVVPYVAEVVCGQSGRYGFAVRAVPRKGNLPYPCTPPLVTWEN